MKSYDCQCKSTGCDERLIVYSNNGWIGVHIAGTPCKGECPTVWMLPSEALQFVQEFLQELMKMKENNERHRPDETEPS
jgi:hypothetical protein